MYLSWISKTLAELNGDLDEVMLKEARTLPGDSLQCYADHLLDPHSTRHANKFPITHGTMVAFTLHVFSATPKSFLDKFCTKR